MACLPYLSTFLSLGKLTSYLWPYSLQQGSVVHVNLLLGFFFHPTQNNTFPMKYIENPSTLTWASPMMKNDLTNTLGSG